MKLLSPKRKGTVKKEKHLMKGGPLNGKFLWLSCPGTLPFKLNGQNGYYNQQNQWVEVE